MVQNFSAYLRLARLDKPRGILLLMWPTWAALLVVFEGVVPWDVFSVFTLGVILMRSVGCCVNDYADRDIDLHVRRTNTRPLATGELKGSDVFPFVAGLLMVSLGLWFYLNTPAKIAALISLAIGVVYPFTKRFFFVHS